MTKKVVRFFSGEKGWHPSVAAPGDTNPSDATAHTDRQHLTSCTISSASWATKAVYIYAMVTLVTCLEAREILEQSYSHWLVMLHTVTQESYCGSGSAVLSSGSTSSIYGMIAPDAVIPQHQVNTYTCSSDVTLTSSTPHRSLAVILGMCKSATCTKKTTQQKSLCCESRRCW